MDSRTGDALVNALLQKTVCGLVSKEDLYVEVAVTDEGKADNDGFRCPPGDFKRSNAYANLDFIYSKIKFTEAQGGAKRTYLIGDFKLNVDNVKTAEKDNRQFTAIVRHARNYGTFVALWVTLFGTEAQARGKEGKYAARLVPLTTIVNMITPMSGRVSDGT